MMQYYVCTLQNENKSGQASVLILKLWLILLFYMFSHGFESNSGVEDATHADLWGSDWTGRRAGSFGVIVVVRGRRAVHGNVPSGGICRI